MGQTAENAPRRPPAPEDWRELIDRWPTIIEMAQDIGMSVDNLRVYKSRNSIRAEWFCAIVEAAKSRGYTEITYKGVCEIAERLARKR